MFARRRSSPLSLSPTKIAQLTCLLCLWALIDNAASMSLDRLAVERSDELQQQNDKQLDYSEMMALEADSNQSALNSDMMMIDGDVDGVNSDGSNSISVVPVKDGQSDVYLLVPAAAPANSQPEDNHLQSLSEQEESLMDSSNSESMSDMLMLESEDTPAMQILELPEEMMDIQMEQERVTEKNEQNMINAESAQTLETQEEVKETSQEETKPKETEEEVSESATETMADALANVVQEIENELEIELMRTEENKSEEREETTLNQKSEDENMSNDELPMEHKDVDLELTPAAMASGEINQEVVNSQEAEKQDSETPEMIGVVMEQETSESSPIETDDLKWESEEQVSQQSSDSMAEESELKPMAVEMPADVEEMTHMEISDDSQLMQESESDMVKEEEGTNMNEEQQHAIEEIKSVEEDTEMIGETQSAEETHIVEIAQPVEDESVAVEEVQPSLETSEQIASGQSAEEIPVAVVAQDAEENEAVAESQMADDETHQVNDETKEESPEAQVAEDESSTADETHQVSDEESPETPAADDETQVADETSTADETAQVSDETKEEEAPEAPVAEDMSTAEQIVNDDDTQAPEDSAMADEFSKVDDASTIEQTADKTEESQAINEEENQDTNENLIPASEETQQTVESVQQSEESSMDDGQDAEELKPVEESQVAESEQQMEQDPISEESLPVQEGMEESNTVTQDESHPSDDQQSADQSQMSNESAAEGMPISEDEEAKPQADEYVQEIQSEEEAKPASEEAQMSADETQTVNESQSSEEVKPVETADEETQSVEEAQPAEEDAQPVEESQSIESARPMDESQTDEELQSVEAAVMPAAEDTKPIEVIQSDEESQSVQESISAEETQPEPVVELQTLEDSQPIQETQSIENALPVEEVQTAGESQSIEEAQPVEETQTMEEAHPVEEAQPMEEAQPIEEAQPMEVAQPMEDTQHDQEIETAEESQSAGEEPQTHDESNTTETSQSIEEPQTVEETQTVSDSAATEEIQSSDASLPVEETKPESAPEVVSQVFSEVASEQSESVPMSDEIEVVREEHHAIEEKPLEIMSDETHKEEHDEDAQSAALADEESLQTIEQSEDIEKEQVAEQSIALQDDPILNDDTDNTIGQVQPQSDKPQEPSMLTTILQVPPPMPEEEQQHDHAVVTTVKPMNVVDSVLNYVNASFMNQMHPEDSQQQDLHKEDAPFNSKLRRYDGAQVWRIVVQNDRERKLADELQSKYDGQLWKEVKQEVDYLLKPQVLADAERHVRAANLSRIVLIDNLQQAIEVENPPAEEIAQLQNRKGHRLTWQAYHRLEDIHGFFDYMAKTYPDICSVETIGHSIEKRPLKILKISNGNANNAGIWIDGGMHAREWISPAVVTYLANQLVEGWDDLPAHMRSINWYIHAVANPDGYEYSHTTDRLWRKNMRSHGRACPGVDLNRNFGYKWGGKGTSANPCAQTYRGSKAFSEPETFYISKFISNFPRDTFKAYLSFHSYGQYILYPWGYDYHITKDMADLDLVARQAGTTITRRSGVKYTVGSSAHTLYPAAGGSDDWAKGFAGIKYAYTVEMGDTGRYGFVLPASHIEPNGKDGYTFVETVARAITMGKNSRRRKLKAKSQ